MEANPATNSFNEIFVNLVKDDFLEYCEDKGLPDTRENMINFFCVTNLISPKTVKKYFIVKTFAHIFPKHDYHKTKAVHELAQIFGMHVNTIWAILKSYYVNYNEGKETDEAVQQKEREEIRKIIELFKDPELRKK